MCAVPIAAFGISYHAVVIQTFNETQDVLRLLCLKSVRLQAFKYILIDYRCVQCAMCMAYSNSDKINK